MGNYEEEVNETCQQWMPAAYRAGKWINIPFKHIMKKRYIFSQYLDSWRSLGHRQLSHGKNRLSKRLFIVGLFEAIHARLNDTCRSPAMNRGTTTTLGPPYSVPRADSSMTIAREKCFAHRRSITIHCNCYELSRVVIASTLADEVNYRKWG